jgi:hypothetical protein
VSPDANRSYVRLDATASRIFRVDLGARSFTLVPYLRLVNALNRRDALFFYRAADGSAEPLAALPALATIGVRWDGTLSRR